LELGCEEIPDKQLEIAFESVKSGFTRFLQEMQLSCEAFFVSGTPRRIYLSVEGLQARQQDVEVVKAGPAIGIAYNAEGNLSPAGQGFLKKTGAEASQIYTMETDKGSFIAVKFLQVGKPSEELLSQWLAKQIMQIPFAKRMIWNDPSAGFSRPLRWILALYNDKVLPLEFFGVQSGNFSFGNRYLGLNKPLAINNADAYPEILETNKVVASADKRRQMICEQLAGIFPNGDFRVIEDQRLVDTVCNLVEYPWAVVGEFEEKYLSLPEKIIISTISQNQKYFSVKDAGGAMSNKFVFISNGDPKHSQLIKLGNQKVVNARLADAMWYFQEDTKHPLESFVPRLSEVVFQAKLGTMADKTKRIKQLCRFIAEELHLEKSELDLVLRCAHLCKADLVTTMLGEKEFTKLQGYIGMQYAASSGEDSQVAKGIYQHYMPRGSADELPDTLCGSIVAIADKMDTVAGIIGIGMLPTGSGDPFALRRSANGIVQIISARSWDVDLFALAARALDELKNYTSLDEKARENLFAFLDQRVVGLLKEQGTAYDVINSVMHIDKSHINDLENRARALQALKSHEDFIRLVIGFKRVANIIANTKEFCAVNEQLLVEEAEKNLYLLLQKLHGDIDMALQAKDYGKALTHLIAFGVAIDNFFDAVLVNCDDEAIKNNRHALMWEVKQEFLRVADLSQIVLEA
jgi:glycyl-tRNA synthetase beta chain